MKCSRVALLLLLVLTSGTAGVLATDNGTAVVGQQVLPPLPCLETFRHVTLFQSPICKRGDELAAGAGSPYDTYYTNALDSGYYAENSQDKRGEQFNNNAKSGETRVGADESSASDARLVSFQRGMSWLAASGEQAMGYVSHCWEQAVTFLGDRDPSDEEVGLESDDAFEDWAEEGWAEMADETHPVETEHVAVAKPPHSKRVECLYVASCPTYDNPAFLATLGRATIEYPLGVTSRSVLFGEYYCVDGEFCPTLTPNADFANQWRFLAGGTDQARTDDQQVPAASSTSLAIRLAHLAKSSLNEWNVAFRNISRQIARLDWTLLFRSQPADRAVQNTAPAAHRIAR